MGRAHRIGQQEVVNIYRYYVNGTIIDATLITDVVFLNEAMRMLRVIRKEYLVNLYILLWIVLVPKYLYQLLNVVS
ncbi:putative P-loop containing nucleoside triphosphate hydrolase [Helianthus annuus]|nr:putative P-loop containing nucleoside triphosphate hydrolase [Helianthus annuus]